MPKPDFPHVTSTAWREAAIQVLGGGALEERLVTLTPEGIRVAPLYSLADDQTSGVPGLPPFTRGGRLTDGVWRVCQEYTSADPAVSNAELKRDVARGVTGAWIRTDNATRSGLDPDATSQIAAHGGVSLATIDDIAALLADVDVQRIAIYLDAGAAAPSVAALTGAWCTDTVLSEMRGSFGFDPLGTLATTGELPETINDTFEEMRDLVSWSAEHAPGMRAVLVSTAGYSDAGASAVQELAYAVATGIEYMRRMDSPVNLSCRQILFDFAIGSDFFMEIAKLRAARLLWAKVVTAAGGDKIAQRMVQHARTSTWTKTRRDPWVNALRATTESFAAAIGGADSITTAPLDELLATADDLFRRLAVNTQITLKEEAHLHRVLDPAGGSWYVESLTDQLARAAWERFQEIERAGGMTEAMMNGVVLDDVGAVAVTKADAVARRERVVVGVSRFAAEEEVMSTEMGRDPSSVHHEARRRVAEYRARHGHADTTRIAAARSGRPSPSAITSALVSAARSGATVGLLTEALRDGSVPVQIRPLTPFCAAQAFEELRDAADAFMRANGAPPHVALVTLGDAAQFRAPLAFAADALRAGGFTLEEFDGNASDVGDRVAARDIHVAVLCGSDEVYVERAGKVAPLLWEAGVYAVAIAGRFAEHEAALRAAGVTQAIHQGANIASILRSLLEAAGGAS